MISMNISLNFVVLLLSISIVESVIHMKSIKLNKNVVYDCMNIYEQPSLSHPLLKHHNIQMNPSVWDSQAHNEFVDRRQKKKIECPNGTVPILRTRKEYVMYSQEYSNNHFNLLTPQNPGSHIAGMGTKENNIFRGVEAGMRTYDLTIDKNQSSSAQAYLATQSNNNTNSIQAGWMINEQLYGDKRPWSYGLWLGKHGKSCINVQCPGFVQVAKDEPLSKPLKFGYLLLISIHQDKKTKNWWLTQIKPDKSRINVGYWPNELFNHLENGADFVGFGGIVTSDTSKSRDPSPPMGNGRLPNKKNRLWSASVDHLSIIDSNYSIVGFYRNMSEPLVDNNKCYDVNYLGYVNDDVGIVMSYGGPGGLKCGD